MTSSGYDCELVLRRRSLTRDEGVRAPRKVRPQWFQIEFVTSMPRGGGLRDAARSRHVTRPQGKPDQLGIGRARTPAAARSLTWRVMVSPARSPGGAAASSRVPGFVGRIEIEHNAMALGWRARNRHRRVHRAARAKASPPEAKAAFERIGKAVEGIGAHEGDDLLASAK